MSSGRLPAERLERKAATLQASLTPDGLSSNGSSGTSSGASSDDSGTRVCERSTAAAAALQAGRWQELQEERCDPQAPRVASCTAKLGHQFRWHRQVCGSHSYTPQQLRRLLAGRTVVVLGDSHGRSLWVWLVRLLNGAFDTTIDDPLKFWADASWDGSSASGQPAGPGGGGDLHVRLRWLPTVPPIAAAIRQMLADSALPDVVVISSGSWYPAEKRPVEQLQADLADLAAAAAEADAAARQASTACCWVGRDVLWLLLTAPSRVGGRGYTATWHVRPAALPPYNAALRSGPLLRQHGGPALLLDLQALTEDCLAWCSFDGVHVNAAAYALAVQIMANLLALPSAPPVAQERQQQQQQQQGVS